MIRGPRLVVDRRVFMATLGTAPLWFGASLGCNSKPPETPLAHLYGKDWVHGAYSLYADKYAGAGASLRSPGWRGLEMGAIPGVQHLCLS